MGREVSLPKPDQSSTRKSSYSVSNSHARGKSNPSSNKGGNRKIPGDNPIPKKIPGDNPVQPKKIPRDNPIVAKKIPGDNPIQPKKIPGDNPKVQVLPQPRTLNTKVVGPTKRNNRSFQLRRNRVTRPLLLPVGLLLLLLVIRSVPPVRGSRRPVLTRAHILLPTLLLIACLRRPHIKRE